MLDPFMGSGSTGKAAILEGFDFIGIDREAEYCAIAEARCAHAARLPTERAASPVAARKGKGGNDSQTTRKNRIASLFDIEESDHGGSGGTARPDHDIDG